MSLVTRERWVGALLSFACVGFGPCSSDEWGTYWGYEPVACMDDRLQPALVGGLEPAEPASYLELRLLGGKSDVELSQSQGQACEGAIDGDLCETTLAELSVASGFTLGDCADGCKSYFLIHNRGDEIGVVTSRVDLVRYLAPIDTTDEALLVAASAGYQLTCVDPNRVGVISEHGSGLGIGVIATRYKTTCDPAEEWQYDLVVKPDGSIEVQQAKPWASRDICLD